MNQGPADIPDTEIKPIKSGDSPVAVNFKFSFGLIEVVLKSKWAKILSVLITLAIGFFLIRSCVIENVYPYFEQLPPSICVFLPDPARKAEGAFYQDGEVQKMGFEKAILDADKIVSCLPVEYQYMKREDTPEQTLQQMKKCYESGATFFIMTMSSKIGKVRGHFKKWHDECRRMGTREPILIATVASAPDIADASGGILRWYIRSEEESALLAEYLRWKEGVTRVGVFYITQTVGQADDHYGAHGMREFRDRFLSLDGITVEDISTTTSTAKLNVSKFLANIPPNNPRSMNDVGVFIVGYGDMVREVLNELLSQGFSGPIACASTLTEPDWQPQDKNADNRIFTVMPRLSDSRTKLEKGDRNVVFFFAKQTLTRTLELTAKDSDSRTFVSRWKQDASNTQLVQACLENGDTIVHLNVVGSEAWR